VFTRSYASRTFVPDELILCSGLMQIVSTEVGSLTSYYVIIRISQTIPRSTSLESGMCKSKIESSARSAAVVKQFAS
jgi:hypothetical protein